MTRALPSLGAVLLLLCPGLALAQPAPAGAPAKPPAAAPWGAPKPAAQPPAPEPEVVAPPPEPPKPTPVDPTADEEITVLTIQTLDAFEQAEAFSVALRRAVGKALGYKLRASEKDLALQVLVLSLDCVEPPDAACEERIATEIASDTYVYGLMKKEGGEVTGTLHLYRRGGGTKKTAFRFSANLTDGADDALVSLAAKHLDEITGGAPPATITIRAGSLDGRVMRGEEQLATLSRGVATVKLAPGAHELEVVADGYETMALKVDAKTREQREIKLTPIAKQDSGPDYQKIFGFTSLGLGAVAAGVATYAGVRVLSVNGDLDQYRNTNIEAGEDGCDPGDDDRYPYVSQPNSNEVIALCREGKPMETLTLAMWPVAGTLAGLGVVLLATADWGGGETETALPLHVIPDFGPSHASVTVSGRF